MDPVSSTPTEPQDYALLSTAFAALVAAVGTAAARRQDDVLPRDAHDLLLYTLATAGLARVLAAEKVASWVRAPFVDEQADGRRPKGRRMRFVVGELLTCTRCLGSWSALGLLGARTVAPGPARAAATVLALSYGNNILQSTFATVRATAQTSEDVADKVAGTPAETIASTLAERAAAR